MAGVTCQFVYMQPTLKDFAVCTVFYLFYLTVSLICIEICIINQSSSVGIHILVIILIIKSTFQATAEFVIKKLQQFFFV